MKKQGSGIIINSGNAFFSTSNLTDNGFWLIDKSFTKPLTVEGIVAGIKKDLTESGKKKINATDELMKNHRKNDPMLKATGAKSWKQLAKESATYGVVWFDDKVVVQLHKLDKKGRFAAVHEGRNIELPKDTSLEEIALMILEDVKKFPYAL